MRTILPILLLLIPMSSIGLAQKEAAIPYAYANNWPEGRGFDVGKTVPDIPLIDLEGNEVRFSNFLGKRYVLYCWASW